MGTRQSQRLLQHGLHLLTGIFIFNIKLSTSYIYVFVMHLSTYLGANISILSRGTQGGFIILILLITY